MFYDKLISFMVSLSYLDSILISIPRRVYQSDIFARLMRGGGNIRIFVRTIDCKISLDVDPFDTIKTIKERVNEVYQTRLIFNGQGLSDDKTLSDYNIHQDSTIDSVIALFHGHGDRLEKRLRCEEVVIFEEVVSPHYKSLTPPRISTSPTYDRTSPTYSPTYDPTSPTYCPPYSPTSPSVYCPPYSPKTTAAAELKLPKNKKKN